MYFFCWRKVSSTDQSIKFAYAYLQYDSTNFENDINKKVIPTNNGNSSSLKPRINVHSWIYLCSEINGRVDYFATTAVRTREHKQADLLPVPASCGSPGNGEPEHKKRTVADLLNLAGGGVDKHVYDGPSGVHPAKLRYALRLVTQHTHNKRRPRDVSLCIV